MMARRKQTSTMAEQFAGARADWDAAKKTRFKKSNSGTMLRSTGSAADYHYRIESDYFGMIEESRDLFRNHALVGQGVRRLVSNILSGGFTLDVRTGDKALDDDNAGRWKEWSEDADQCDIQGESDFHKLENLTLEQVITDGDLITLPTVGGWLQQIENHRLRTPHRTTRNIVHGVQLNDTDKPRPVP